jgi:hypothetical protein
MTSSPISAAYSTRAANKAISLGRARLTITCNGQSLSYPGTATLRLQPRLRLVLKADLSEDPLAILRLGTARGTISVQYGSKSRPTNVIMTDSSSNFSSAGATSTAEFFPNPQRLTICQDRRTRLKSVTFHVMNFPVFFSQGGEAADFWYQSSSGQRSRLGCAVLEDHIWRIEFQTLPDADALIRQLKSQGGYAINHVGRLMRKDGSAFWISQAEHALEDIHLFLSFVRGLWVPLVLPVGVDEAGNRVFEEWGCKLETAWEPCLTWFDTDNGQSLGELYSGFIDLLHDQDLGEAVKSALYWYLRSNRAGEGAGVDSGVILSQAALERLTTAYLVKLGTSTQRHAAENFRAALRHLKLPTAIPQGMSALSTARRKGIWKDLPDAIVKVRNELVHPDARLNIRIGKVVAGVWNAAQWYVELCILRLAGYRGVYSRRIHTNWRGEVERVPWAR